MVAFLVEDCTFPDFDKDLYSRWISTVVIEHGFCEGDISIVFCSDRYILEVNQNFLNHDFYTDIITFDYCEGDTISGDLLISLDTVFSNSEQYKTDFLEELGRVMIHGVLHLIGFDDKSAKTQAEMRKQENKSLALLRTL